MSRACLTWHPQHSMEKAAFSSCPRSWSWVDPGCSEPSAFQTDLLECIRFTKAGNGLRYCARWDFCSHFSPLFCHAIALLLNRLGRADFLTYLGVAMWLDSANEMWASVMLADALWFCLDAWLLPSAIRRIRLGWLWPCGDTQSRLELHLWLGVKPSWSQQSQGAWGRWARKGTFVLSHQDLEIVMQQNYLHVPWWIFNKKN